MAYRKMTKAEVIAECLETFREFPEIFRGDDIANSSIGMTTQTVSASLA